MDHNSEEDKDIVLEIAQNVFAVQAILFTFIMLLAFALGEWNATIAAALISIHGMYTNKHITRNK